MALAGEALTTTVLCAASAACCTTVVQMHAGMGVVSVSDIANLLGMRTFPVGMVCA